MPAQQRVDRFFYENPKGTKGHRPGSRIPVWLNLGLSLLLACLAVAMRSPWAIATLACADLVYLGLCRGGWVLLGKAIRALAWQSALLMLLHYMRFGPDGLLPAMRISCQLFLAFLPGMIFLQSTCRSQLVQLASRLFPPTGAFVLGASLHFVPLLIGEVREIYRAQILRGARILPIDIFKPWCWPDWVGCLIVPCTVQALALAGEIALAAKARDFGTCRRRTCWPGAGVPPHPEREP